MSDRILGNCFAATRTAGIRQRYGKISLEKEQRGWFRGKSCSLIVHLMTVDCKLYLILILCIPSSLLLHRRRSFSKNLDGTKRQLPLRTVCDRTKKMINDIVHWRMILPMDTLSTILSSCHYQQKYWMHITMLNVHHSWDSSQKFIGNYLDSYESSNY